MYNPWLGLPCWTFECLSKHAVLGYEENLNGAGEPKNGTDCLQHELNSCKSDKCRSGYHFNDKTNVCEVNICSCPNGVAELGPSQSGEGGCVVHGSEKCLENQCLRGYHYDFDSKTCVQNICYADNFNTCRERNWHKTEVCDEPTDALCHINDYPCNYCKKKTKYRDMEFCVLEYDACGPEGFEFMYDRYENFTVLQLELSPIRVNSSLSQSRTKQIEFYQLMHSRFLALPALPALSTKKEALPALPKIC